MNVVSSRVIAAAMWIALPIAAAAQDTPTSVQPPPAKPNTTSPKSTSENEWVASGFLGSNFANNAKPASMDGGATVAYLWQQKLGAEFEAGFTPNFQLQNNFFGLGVKPQVNSYMANAMWSIPHGEGKLQPFLSGGIGAISLRSGLGTAPGAANSTLNPDDTRFGGDIGAGLMSFAGNWGFKADVRYYRASGTYNTTSTSTTNASPTSPTPAPAPPGGYSTTSDTAPTAGSTVTPSATTGIASAALSGLHFWRGNVGLAVRW